MMRASAAFGLLLGFVLSGMGQADTITDWNTVAVNTIKTDGTVAPRASRALAMMHAAMYDAANSVARKYAPYRVDLSHPNPASPEMAAAAAAHRVMTVLFPKHRAEYDQALARTLERRADETARKNGVELGKRVADAILGWRKNDRSSEVVVYKQGSGPGEWQPTPSAFAAPLVPNWPNVTPFAMKSGSQFRPSGPPGLDSKEFADALREVKTLGGKSSTLRTKDQTEIPHFWADAGGTESLPGHWNLIARQLAAGRKYDLVQNARLYALLNVAMADAAIASYDSKYAFRFWRPITVIQQSDPDWVPLLDTPSFPEYTAAHSTVSAAAARMLALVLGSDEMRFTLPSSTPLAGPRAFSSLSQSADEAGRSRIYAGIHYEFSNRDGLETGRRVADYVFHNFMRPLNAARDQ